MFRHGVALLLSYISSLGSFLSLIFPQTNPFLMCHPISIYGPLMVTRLNDSPELRFITDVEVSLFSTDIVLM